MIDKAYQSASGKACRRRARFETMLVLSLEHCRLCICHAHERREDVVPLMDHFRKMFLKRHGKSAAHFSPAVTRRFFEYDWPGNIRQLRNFVETMVVLDTDGVLDINDLPPELSQPDDLSFSPAANNVAASSSVAPILDANGLPSIESSGLIGKTMDQIERWAIEETLKLTGNNREEAAKRLGIGARTLYRKLKTYEEHDQNPGASNASVEPDE
ncbi:MAG: helix-turn-helix domain-containing protein [Pirellulales bacterium]